MESKGMHALLGVFKGSCEHPAVLEIGYCGGSIEEKPILLVGMNIQGDSVKACQGKSSDIASMRYHFLRAL